GQGDLPGGIYNSAVYAVNGAGTTWVGESNSANGGRIARWTNAGVFQDLGPGRAWGVDALGDTVVGHAYTATGGKPFRWNRTTGYAHPPTLPSSSNTGIAYDISSAGTIVIGNSDSFSAPTGQAFLWTPADGTQSLRDFLVNNGIDMTGWTLDRAYG